MHDYIQPKRMILIHLTHHLVLVRYGKFSFIQTIKLLRCRNTPY